MWYDTDTLAFKFKNLTRVFFYSSHDLEQSFLGST